MKISTRERAAIIMGIWVYCLSILCTVVDSSDIKMCGSKGKEAGTEMHLLGTPPTQQPTGREADVRSLKSQPLKNVVNGSAD